MLSIEDFYKEIGRNIYIYPLKDMKILGNSVDLTASEFAWTTDGKYIYNEEEKVIKVPAHKTACILTREAIYVTSKIGGTYHSRVTLAKRGFGHVGTMLDPEYIGQSLIILHNTTDKEQTIQYGERIVSVVFYYLHTPILTKSHNSSPGHRDKMASFEKIDKYNQWCDDNRWASEKRELVYIFKQSDEYKELKEKRKIDRQQWGGRISRVLYNKRLKSYGILFLVCVIIYGGCNLVLSGMGVSDKANLIGVLLAGVIGSIYSDWGRS